MSFPVSVNDIMAVKYFITYANQTYILDLDYYIKSVVGSPFDPAKSVLNAALPNFTTLVGIASPAGKLAAFIASDAVVDRVTLQIVSTSPRSPVVVGAIGGNTPGNATATEGNTALALQFVTDDGGRRGYCTKHLGPLQSTDKVEGTFITAAKTRAMAIGTAYHSDQTWTLGSGTYTASACIDHRVVIAGSRYTPITGFQAQNTVRTMHRRTLGLGI